MYSLKIILLENCFYSDELKKILSKKPLNKIPVIYIIIKEEDKIKYKNDDISTFPQVYMIKKKSNGKLLIGGCDDTKKLIEIIQHNKKMNTVNSLISKIYPLWSEKAKLRLIELFS